MHKILIAGAGQLGSRYLQGLAKVSQPLQIYVFDLFEDALQNALTRWNEVDVDGKNNHRLFFVKDVSTIPSAIDIAIVATSANSRTTVVGNIAAVSKVSYWVLEKVLAQNSLQINVIEEVVTQSKAAWVNTPRRAMQWYKHIKEHVQKDTPLELDVTGGSWGLACNAVHFIDLLQYLTGEKLEVIDTSNLTKNWFESKRKGFWEIDGTLIAKFSGGSIAKLNVTPGNEPCEITCKGQKDIWIINENAGKALASNGLTIEGRLNFQSEMTVDLVESIITKGKCRLPTFAESKPIYTIFLDAMLDHWRRHVDAQAILVPIT